MDCLYSAENVAGSAIGIDAEAVTRLAMSPNQSRRKSQEPQQKVDEMTAKPETAAEVLAGKRKEFEESEWLEIEAKAEVLCERYRMRKRAGGNVASFRDFLPYWAAVAAVERALSAQGTPIGWGEIDHGRLVSFTASRTERNTAPLYTHPAPARVTDMLALAHGAWRAGITLGNNICVQESDRENDQDGDCGWINGTAECAKRIREWADPEDAQLVEFLNEAGVDTSALTAALEADHAPE